ncbi:hypothetical protein AMK21_24605 [Streptomyces sp. CB00316]|nr:hypothetical protein AMK21_24605 [Streptomyces sp. CB00316]
MQSAEASLGRLRTDRSDVLRVHARDSCTPVEEVMRALDDLVRTGRVVYVGVSDWPAREGDRWAAIEDRRSTCRRTTSEVL